MLPDNVENHLNKGLEQFIQPLSMDFFKRFNINTQFLKKDPLTWKNDDNYNSCLDVVKHLKVVNDSAERGVKLTEDFNNLLTKHENQKQCILQVGSDYRHSLLGDLDKKRLKLEDMRDQGYDNIAKDVEKDRVSKLGSEI
nr:unnamed protein product [Callosobruchus analis]